MIDKKNSRVAWLFLTPTLILFVTFIAFPVLFSAFLSFTEWNFVSGISGIKFIGLENFKKLLENETFHKALRNTVVYTITIVPISVVLSLILAYLLNDKVYFKKSLRLAFFVPYISNAVALATIFRFMFRSTGPINHFLNIIGFENAPKWLSDPNLTKIPIIVLMIWTSIGYQVLIYMAALQDVPRELYEAAAIDGASPQKRFMNITIPLVSPTTFFLVIIRTIAVFKMFTPVKIMSGQNMDRSTTTLVMEVYREAFDHYNFGYASALAWVLFLIILGITLFQLWGQKKWVHY